MCVMVYGGEVCGGVHARNTWCVRVCAAPCVCAAFTTKVRSLTGAARCGARASADAKPTDRHTHANSPHIHMQTANTRMHIHIYTLRRTETHTLTAHAGRAQALTQSACARAASTLPYNFWGSTSDVREPAQRIHFSNWKHYVFAQNVKSYK